MKPAPKSPTLKNLASALGDPRNCKKPERLMI
jgi:hypothetical protein